MKIKRMLLLLPLMTALAFAFGAAFSAEVALADNSACFICHGTESEAPTQTIAGKSVSLWVDPVAYAASTHGAQDCITCHGSQTEAHEPANRNYGGWARFSSQTTTATWNFWKVSGDKCVACHAGAAGFAASDHATTWNMAHTPDGAPRTVVDLLGTDGVTYHADENYTQGDCGRCHMGNNCAPCHWEAPIINNPGSKATGGFLSILQIWNNYSDSATTAKGSLSENAIDWTQNISGHDFRGTTDLTTSNTVCKTCHEGYRQKPDASIAAIGIYGPGYSRHGQLQEMQRSAARGVHETLQMCTDCHTAVHDVTSPESMLQWRQNPDVTCVSCHADHRIAGAGKPHQNVSCVACHAVGVDAILDPNGRGLGLPLVIPRVVKHNVQQGWASHDLSREVDCSRCHTSDSQTGAPPMRDIAESIFSPHARSATTTTLRCSATTVRRGSYVTLTARLLGGSGYTNEYLRFEVFAKGMSGYKVYKTVKVSSTGYATYRYKVYASGTRYHRVRFLGSALYLPAPVQHGLKLVVR